MIIGQDRAVEERAAAKFVYNGIVHAIELTQYPRKIITLSIGVINEDGGVIACGNIPIKCVHHNLSPFLFLS